MRAAASHLQRRIRGAEVRSAPLTAPLCSVLEVFLCSWCSVICALCSVQGLFSCSLCSVLDVSPFALEQCTRMRTGAV